jgi:hypothetical protein
MLFSVNILFVTVSESIVVETAPEPTPLSALLIEFLSLSLLF